MERITAKEIRQAVRETKYNKISGLGGISIELINHVPEILYRTFEFNFNKCLTRKREI
jgi:hypothetical protein